jgi:hypothetical protein
MLSHFNQVADVWATQWSAAIYRRPSQEAEATMESAETSLYIASVKVMSHRLARYDRRLPGLSLVKSMPWRCGGDSSQMG